MMSERICKICGSHGNFPTYEPKEMMFGFRHTFLYFQCSQCECLQIAEFPSNIADYYPTHYYSLKVYDGKKFQRLGGIVRRMFLHASIDKKGFFNSLLKWISPSKQYAIFNGLHVSATTRILDVGCGNGHKFLYPMAAIGLNHIMGCDPFITEDIRYPNGLTILKNDVFGMKGKWDVITYHHSFEHIPNPLENLKKVSELLDDEGVCIIRIPTVSSYAWQHYKTNWFQLDAPRHYFLHSVKSMEYMASQSGLKLVQVVYDSTHNQFTESERYCKDISLREPRPKGFLNFLKRKVKKIQYVTQAKHLNKTSMGDQAAFFLRKGN